jgi:hypothetical protein
MFYVISINGNIHFFLNILIYLADVTNVAIGRRTYMSSVYQGYNGSMGVDGNSNQLWSGRSCFHTKNDLHSWWRVDLGKIYRCFRVVLYNRLDDCSKLLIHLFRYLFSLTHIVWSRAVYNHVGSGKTFF